MGCPVRMSVYLHALFGPIFFKVFLQNYLFADDTNTQANNNLKSLESVVKEELRKVCEWLNTNKLSLNKSKSNFVIFHPYISVYFLQTNCMGTSLHKILILRKRALRLMYFPDRRAQAIPLFIRSGVLPLNMLYFKYSAILMHDISNNRAPSKISELFVRSNMIHFHLIPDFLSAAGNFYVQRSRLNQLLLSFSRGGVRTWNYIPLKLIT